MARIGLALVLVGATAYADPAPTPAPATPPAPVVAPAKPADAKQPLRLVRITADGKAALILDRNRNRSILVEVGDGIAGYIVETIEDDAVTLVHKNGTQLVLAAATPAPAAPSGKPETTAKSPQDPYGPSASPADPYAPPAAPADPYAPAVAPSDPYAPTGPVTSPATVSAPARRTVSAPSKPGAAPAVARPPVLAPPPADPVMTADGKIELKKAEVDAALKDFNALASSIAASFTGGGLKVDAVVSGSLFARAGLQKGDIIVAIDGRPLRSLDDAADLYARAATLKALTVQVVRGGKPGSFQIAIR